MPSFPLPLLEADGLEVTILVDNTIDALLAPTELVRRRPWIAGVSNPFIDGTVNESLRAEHGFSALVSLLVRGREHRLLFDAGLTRNGLIENMAGLQIDPFEIEATILSHGHFDHTGGLDGLLGRLGRANMPMVVHPAVYTKRRSAPPGREPTDLPPPSRSALEGAGFDLLESGDPSLLFHDSLLVTGEVPRVTSFETGFPFFQREVEGRWEPEPHLADDQALIVSVRGKGIVILTGCGHSGIVNIVRRAQQLTGIEQIAGIIGGFHLPPPFFDATIPAVIDAMRNFDPGVLVPGHCTGYKAQQALANALPEAYVANAVGTTIVF